MINVLIDEFNLLDIWRHFHPNLRQYTRHQRNPKVLSRLDFILVSDNFVNNCLNSKIIPGVNSDHSIVVFQFNDNQPNKGPGFWKLNCSYVHNDVDFINLVKKKIQEFKDIHTNSNCNPNILWDALKCTITGVCIDYCTRKKKERNKVKRNLMDDIAKVKSDIENAPSNDTLFDQLQILESKLNTISEFETKGLITRSRSRWMEEGEKSTKYFCNLEKRTWQKKCINRVKKGDTLICNQKDVMVEIQNYFQNLYSNPNADQSISNDIELFLEGIEIPKLSDEDKQIIDQPITKQELYNTLVSMKLNKTPGFDGLPVEFYIVFWPDISEMYLNSLNYSMENGIMSHSQRNGIITLLPKKDKDVLYIGNHRPISLLTVDYKILAKTLANRIKTVLNSLIHSDQSGFLKGRNIGNNIRLIMDIIEFTDVNEIPGAILLLDIEKAFDSVSHEFLFRVLNHFNFGDHFISWIKTLYCQRKSYVINNGFLTKDISMDRGIFQGCPISPYLFLLAIETMALAIRQNKDIKGIPVQDNELKISLLADDSTCFLDGSHGSFFNLFNTLDRFALCSGCKINLTKSEAIWIGSKVGSSNFPLSDRGLTWKANRFKTLGIHFSLKISSMFDLNYKVKLKQIEGTLNCWRARNLSLVGKICVIKSLLLPQLLYLFSVLSLKIPMKFFKDLNKMFYKFIWNGGRDRVKRNFLCNDYSQGGLRMIDPYAFALAQKMTWVKLLLDNSFDSFWKAIEFSALDKYGDMLWESYAPECVLNNLESSQLADSIRTSYVYRNKAVKDIFGEEFSDMGLSQCLWYNRNIRSKSKKFFFYEDWYDKGIVDVSDLINPPHPGFKLFEELVLDFDISSMDRRKYNFLMKNIPHSWFKAENVKSQDIFNTLVDNLLATQKVPKFSYSTFIDKSCPDKRISFWNCLADDMEDPDWTEIHLRNYKCTIDTRFRAFYFKIFHNSIAFNDFLFKIKRKDSPNCCFCEKYPETMVHVFCECEVVIPLWNDMVEIINHKEDVNFSVSNFDKMFGIQDDKFLTFLCLIIKYYIFVSKFQNKKPNFVNLLNFIKNIRETEYNIANRRNKLPIHFKKWRFDL